MLVRIYALSEKVVYDRLLFEDGHSFDELVGGQRSVTRVWVNDVIRPLACAHNRQPFPEVSEVMSARLQRSVVDPKRPTVRQNVLQFFFRAKVHSNVFLVVDLGENVSNYADTEVPLPNSVFDVLWEAEKEIRVEVTANNDLAHGLIVSGANGNPSSYADPWLFNGQNSGLLNVTSAQVWFTKALARVTEMTAALWFMAMDSSQTFPDEYEKVYGKVAYKTAKTFFAGTSFGRWLVFYGLS